MSVCLQGHLLQLVLPVEVKPGASAAQRSATTGNLLLTMPKEDPAAKAIDQSCWRSARTFMPLPKISSSLLQTGVFRFHLGTDLHGCSSGGHAAASNQSTCGIHIFAPGSSI